MSKFKDCVSKCGDLFPTQFLKFKAKIKSLMQKQMKEEFGDFCQ